MRLRKLLLIAVVALTACQTTGAHIVTELPARNVTRPGLTVDRTSIRFTSGYEVQINFQRFEQDGKLAFCVWGISEESPGNLPQLWLNNAFIYFGSIKTAQGSMIPIHVAGTSRSRVARCAATDLDFVKNSLTQARIKGNAVYGEM